MEAYVLNSVGDRLGAQAVRKADGGITLTVNSPGSLRNYVVFVRSQANSTIAAGNYAITVDFTTDPANQLTELYSAQVSPTQEHVSQLRVLKTQLMRFDLSTLGNSSSAGVQLTVYNARTGDIELTLSARSASTSVQYAWLSQGSYYLRLLIARGRDSPRLRLLRSGFGLMSSATIKGRGPTIRRNCLIQCQQ